MKAQEKLNRKTEKALHICVGLDSDINKIPGHLKTKSNAILEFNKRVIDATYKHAAAYKINFAFYENWGLEGFRTLEETINFISNEVLIIADAKRGDIGNTSKKYAESVFDYFKCDAVTLHPYMGYESVEPFLQYENKLNFILGLTSNPSASDFEKQKLENGKYLYQEVIVKTNEWNQKSKNCGLVFGATNNEELKNNIDSFGNMPILLPGVGAQGGSLEDVIKIFYSDKKNNFIINISRGLLYIDESENFEAKIKDKIIEYNQLVEKHIP
ncbi:MAG: orotidine-5'-phosphate decarboxylase [Ignavibacteriae bacterium]|nr:orotidine-5'-phosphate decarboxylase [Ignavibacteriota bacterium]MCB9207487.1 orotidine-5'-phosphate decarboxylase [Ignavibacteriales bacterium]MCB9211322.1 orotidine-5'-phosphate decarboxylase [Ignavibacteriales bacterium]MCB9218714.1 orotidine-5'-phosphate decarboxylase [Ignavibacteriales bacterium]MCB9259280.1 orotidine-5'-phosphate decarboxylase [Ignavibacteriales bacterium]